jgi:hypothetical protein
VRAEWLLAPRPARAQHVEADPANYRRQPSAQVLDAAGVGPAEPEPGFLDRIVGLTQRAQHSVGHRPQVDAVFLELLRKELVLVHGHIRLSRCLMSVTHEIQLM